MNAFRQEVLERRSKLSPEYAEAHTEFMTWYRTALYEVDLNKCPKRVEIRCGVVTGPKGRPCRKLMGQVFETNLGGMFLQKHRVDNGKTMEELDKEHGELYDEWIANPGDSREEYEAFVETRRVSRREGRYLIWERGQEPTHPLPEHLALSRHVVCVDHGLYPFDRLRLEDHYEHGRRTWSM